MKLDYSLSSSQQRNKLVHQIIESTPPEQLSRYYLEQMATYIIQPKTKEKVINTENRLITINKRETSYEGLVTKFQNGEDGVFNIMAENSNYLLSPKISITPADVAQIPFLAELQSNITQIQRQLARARGRRRYLLKKQLIQMRQQQYILKTAYKPVSYSRITKSISALNLNDKIQIFKDDVQNYGQISLMNPSHISILLQHYANLKQSCYGKFESDGYYLIQDLENLIDTAIKEKYPILFKILIYKIDKKQNIEIQRALLQEFNETYSLQYISSLWRHKIPKLIAEASKKDYLIWFYTEKKRGRWKQCTKCKQIKLAHNFFFSRNTSSKDGFYSICKCCRNAKPKYDISHPLVIKRIPYHGRKEEKS